ncbi:MAG: MBL fold metallo-hydrolase, partial [Gemmatimonadaceae bacterium]
ARMARMEHSPQWKDGHFVNPQTIVNDFWKTLTSLFHASADTSPHEPVATAAINPRQLDTLPPTGLRVTWMGHSTTLVEIDGHRVLTDPVWSERPTPVSPFGPQRYYEPLIAIRDLPALDAVVISHDHYDHLDYKTIVALIATKAKFVVPLGVGAHLEYWGVPLDRIVELDWWEQTHIGDMTITLTPSRHASGRTLFDRDATLWGSFVLATPKHRVFYSGDTGLFPALNDIGVRFGPFDLAMIETGQYGAGWPDWHLGPEQAVNASQRVNARTMLPVHWALFTLATHAWTEPVERSLIASKTAGVMLLTPKPGEAFEPTSAHTSVRWWPTLPFKTAAEVPIVSSHVPP